MSILSHQPLAAVPETAQISWLPFVLSAISLVVVIATKAVSLRRLPGPPRIPPDRSAWPLAGILFGAMGIWFFAISACMSVWTTLAPKYGATTQPLESDAGLALLNTVPSVVVLVCLLLGDKLVYDSVHQDLGLEAKRFRRGILHGLGTALLVLPPLYLASQIMELTYRAIHYDHPTEHPMLRVLGQGPSPWIKATIILGACLIAPLAEELIFRAHLQTLLLRAFQYVETLLRPPIPGQNAQPASPDLEVPPVAPEIAPENLSPPSVADNPVQPAAPSLPYASPDLKRRFAVSGSKIPALLSILVTSLLFASVHPAWSFPIIFLLSLALGYAYERTANLWIPITIHATFNTVSTLLFLAGAAGN
jgi:membrane protease YdiL (CAAX protease family)